MAPLPALRCLELHYFVGELGPAPAGLQTAVLPHVQGAADLRKIIESMPSTLRELRTASSLEHVALPTGLRRLTVDGYADRTYEGRAALGVCASPLAHLEEVELNDLSVPLAARRCSSCSRALCAS